MAQPKSVPEGWRITRLGDVCESPKYGASAPAQPFDTNLPRYVRITDITDDGHLRKTDIRSADPQRVAGYELRADDLLFARSGSVGRTYLYRQKDGPCVYAGYLIRFRPRSNTAVARYLELWTRGQFYQSWVTSMLRVGAQPNINATEYSSLPILLPPLGEQRAIARVLDSVDEAIERAEEVVAATERLRDALLHELLTRGLPGQHSDCTEVPGLGTIPASWTVTRLGDMAEVVGGSTPSRTRTEYWGGDIPWVVPSELSQLASRYLSTSRESVTIEGLRVASLRVLPVGSVLLTTRATIGLVAINQVPVTTNQGFQCLIPNKDIYGLWLFYSISQKKQQLERRGAGSTFREVSRDGVRTLPIALPPIEEQRAIAEVLDSVDHSIERAREECDALRLAMKSVSDALLTGRVRTNPQRERSYETAGTG